MRCCLVILLFIVIGYNIPDLQSLNSNIRCVCSTIFCMCALRATIAYGDREIKPLTIALVSCLVCVVCVALTF